MKPTNLLFKAAVAILLLAARATHAQTSDNWWTVDGGGGKSAGGSFILTGTAGQPDAGMMTGGGFYLRGGFWGPVATLPPRLTITLAGNAVNVCWPYPSSGYALFQSDSLTNPVWTAVPVAPTQVDALTWCVSVPVGSAPKYYRLKKTT
jgi:hypothetical protein